MIVVIGKSGHLSCAYQRFFDRRNLPYRCLSRREINPTDPGSVKKVLQGLKPAFLINSAGYTGNPNVDACETRRDECIEGNLVLPMTLKSACADLGLPWGHISSGCIYEGAGPSGQGFTEEDLPNFSFSHQNCSFYSGIKALTESLLREDKQCYIWRPRMPFSDTPGPRNLLTKLMTYPRLVDAANSFSHLDEFVEATWLCLEKKVPFGTYNMTNPGYVTTREITSMMEKLGLGPQTFHFYESVESFHHSVKARRSNCILNTEKLEKAGIRMRPIREALMSSLHSFAAGASS